MSILKSALTRALSPSKCALCYGQLDQKAHWCSYCTTALERKETACFSCGIGLEALSSATANQNQHRQCGECMLKPPLQYRSVCAFDYRFPLPELIGQIKFQNTFEALRPLSEQFSLYCLEQYQDDSLPQVLIPVPLHPNREFKRGFNQAHVLAMEIAKHLKVEINNQLFIRKRHTGSQMQLNIKARKGNLKSVFAAGKSLPSNIEHVAIFDDVITTGATLESLAKEVSKAGVKRIDFWSIARTPKLS
jgi:ComF family protein